MGMIQSSLAQFNYSRAVQLDGLCFSLKLPSHWHYPFGSAVGAYGMSESVFISVVGT